MSRYAQTNRQLYVQLIEAEYARDEILRVRAAHAFGAELFSGLYRPSGSPFISHLVGTASVLVALGQPVDVVIAGLLHAAYMHGDFGRVRTGPTPRNRAAVRRVAGDEAEACIHTYTGLPWGTLVRGPAEGLASLSPQERAALLIRLANELEHYLDDEIVCGPNAERRLQYVRQTGPKLSAAAEALGCPALAAELVRVMRRAAVSESFPGLPEDRADKAYRLPPRSHRLRWMLRGGRGGLRLARFARSRLAR